MTLRSSVAVRNAACDAAVDLVDAGAAAGVLKVYTGAQPATPATAATGTLLATLTFSDPAFGAASAGTAVAAAISDDLAVDATGTAGWFRIEDSDGNALFDGSVGLTGSGADLEFDAVGWVAGGIVSITSLQITFPMEC